MVDISRILGARDVSELRAAVAAAFQELSLEKENAEKILDIEARLKTVEARA